jgi:hypothetical protein
LARKSFLLVFTLAIGFLQPAQASLIANWSGDGTAADSTGNHNGMLVNGAGYGAGTNGQAQAFLFNGVNQYMSAPASTDFAFGNTPFSIGLFANFSSIRTGPIGSLPDVFIGNDEGPGTVNKWVFFYDGNGHLAFHINGPSTGSIFLTSPATFNPILNNWDYYSVTRIGNTYTFNVDFSSLGSVSNSTSIPFPNAPLTIGQAENAGFFNGRIQDVQINSLPEPSPIALALTCGLITGITARLRRRKPA